MSLEGTASRRFRRPLSVDVWGGPLGPLRYRKRTDLERLQSECFHNRQRGLDLDRNERRPIHLQASSACGFNPPESRSYSLG